MIVTILVLVTVIITVAMKVTVTMINGLLNTMTVTITVTMMVLTRGATKNNKNSLLIVFLLKHHLACGSVASQQQPFFTQVSSLIPFQPHSRRSAP